MHNKPQIFKDKDGTIIQAGDILFRQVLARRRERPGHKRVAISGMSGEDTIVPDEGRLLEPEEHWITRKVGWVGACMIAERHTYSDFQVLVTHALFNEKGKRIFESAGFDYMNSCFDSTPYKIVNDQQLKEGINVLTAAWDKTGKEV